MLKNISPRTGELCIAGVLLALAAIVIPPMVRRLGLRLSHLVNLWLGAAGLVSFVFIRDPQWLIASMVGIGFAWASIVSLPYALLSNNLPAAKMGVPVEAAKSTPLCILL